VSIQLHTVLIDAADQGTHEVSWNDIHTECFGRAYDGAGDSLKPEVLEMGVGRFNLGNFIHMLERDGSDDVVAGPRCALLDACRLLEKICCGGRFCDKSKGAVGADGDESGDGHPSLNVCGTSVELLAEIHRFDTTRTKGRTDRRCRRSLASTYEDSLRVSVSFRPPENTLGTHYDNGLCAKHL
jgi:hypothetical protein